MFERNMRCDVRDFKKSELRPFGFNFKIVLKLTMQKFVNMYPIANVLDTIREPLLPQEISSSVVGGSPHGSSELEIAIGYPVAEDEIVVAVPDTYYPPIVQSTR